MQFFSSLGNFALNPRAWVSHFTVVVGQPLLSAKSSLALFISTFLAMFLHKNILCERHQVYNTTTSRRSVALLLQQPEHSCRFWQQTFVSPFFGCRHRLCCQWPYKQPQPLWAPAADLHLGASHEQCRARGFRRKSSVVLRRVKCSIFIIIHA